jgi:hypothetical protein
LTGLDLFLSKERGEGEGGEDAEVHSQKGERTAHPDSLHLMGDTICQDAFVVRRLDQSFRVALAGKPFP